MAPEPCWRNWAAKPFQSKRIKSGFGRFFRSPTGVGCRLRSWDRCAAWQNTGKAATSVSPRFIWRRWAYRASARTPPTRLALAAELLDAGVAPRELARELGFDPPAGLVKYDPDEPRVPAGSGRESGQWTTSGDAASGDAAGSPLTEGRSASANAGDINREHERPKDAIMVTRPDGSKIYDPDSTTKRLMAPPRANFQEVYAAGERTANWPLLQQIDAARIALGQFGTYDFQRDEATNTWFSEYVHAANYAVGVYMAGAGYGLDQSLAFAQAYTVVNSSNAFDNKYKGRDGK